MRGHGQGNGFAGFRIGNAGGGLNARRWHYLFRGRVCALQCVVGMRTHRKRQERQGGEGGWVRGGDRRNYAAPIDLERCATDHAQVPGGGFYRLRLSFFMIRHLQIFYHCGIDGVDGVGRRIIAAPMLRGVCRGGRHRSPELADRRAMGGNGSQPPAGHRDVP